MVWQPRAHKKISKKCFKTNYARCAQTERCSSLEIIIVAAKKKKWFSLFLFRPVNNYCFDKWLRLPPTANSWLNICCILFSSLETIIFFFFVSHEIQKFAFAKLIFSGFWWNRARSTESRKHSIIGTNSCDSMRFARTNALFSISCSVAYAVCLQLNRMCCVLAYQKIVSIVV